MAFDEKGDFLASCSADMTIRLWNFTEFECTKVLRGHDHNISSIDFAAGGNFVVSASRDRSIRVWEVSTGYNQKTLQGHDDWVRSAKVSPDGDLIASCGNDQSCRVWSYATGKCNMELHGHSHVVECLAWAPETARDAINEAVNGPEEENSLPGPFFASAGRDKTIVVWDAGTGSNLFTLKGHDNWIKDLRFHPGGNYLLSAADDKTVRIWDLKTKRCFKTLQAHGHFVNAVGTFAVCVCVSGGGGFLGPLPQTFPALSISTRRYIFPAFLSLPPHLARTRYTAAAAWLLYRVPTPYTTLPCSSASG